MNSVSRGIRNAFRNGIRTFSIIIIIGLSIGLSLAMLVAHQAVGQKITTIKASVANTVSITPAGVRGFDGGGNALTTTQLAAVTKLNHVTGSTESLNDRLTSSNTNLQSAVDAGSLGRRFFQDQGQASPANPGFGSDTTMTIPTAFTPPVTVLGTTQPTDLGSGGGTFKLTSGSVFSSTSSDMVAVVGTKLAAKNNLSVGSTFTAYGSTIKVIGIFDAGNTFSNNQLLLPLATLQTLSSQTGAVTSATLTVDSLSNVPGVTNAVTKQLGSAADVTNGSQQADQLVSPLANIQTISVYSLVGAVVAGAAIILLVMIMIVRERRREIGVLKALGASNLKVVSQFISEGLTFTILAAVVGITLGALAAHPITKLLVTNATSSSMTTVGVGPMGRGFGGFAGGGRGLRAISRGVTNIHTVVGWSIIVDGLVVAIVIALVGSGLTALFITKIRPAEVLRSE